MGKIYHRDKMILPRSIIDVFVALSSLFSMIMNGVKSLRPNVSGVLLMSLAIQQVGNMAVAVNLTSTKLEAYQQQLYIGASLIAFCLTCAQFFLMLYRKMSTRLRFG